MLNNVFTNPSLLFPSLVFPLFFFTAFAGGLSQVSNVPGFDFEPGYTAFQFCFVLLQSAAFGGVFTGFGIARDFESGFARRLLLAAPNRTGIVLGYAISRARALAVTATVLTVVALVAGMNVFGGPVDVFGLYALALLINVAALLWAAGVAMRFRTMQAGPVMQMPVFLVLFFAPVYVPLGAAERLDPDGRDREPAHLRARGGARACSRGDEVHVALAFALALVPRRALRRLVAARAAEGRSGRVTRFGRAARVPSRRVSRDQSAVRGRSARPGVAGFRVWAPRARSVARAARRRGARARARPATASGRASCRPQPGDDYRFVLDGGEAWPDPCSRWQPEGVRGPSRVLDPSRVRDRRRARSSRSTSSSSTSSTSARSRRRAPSTASCRACAELRELGVTAIELMPVATFPGERGWGYDGLYTSAPHPAYGGPDGLARLVDAAHREGLGVILDVVYNHLGPGNEALTAFGPYFTDRFGQTPWGDALDYAQAGRARVGDPERGALGARLPDRRAAARRRPRDPRRLAAARARGARRARARRRARDALVISEMGARRLPAARASGGTTRCGSTASTTRCTSR